jgi:hypothetical protein
MLSILIIVIVFASRVVSCVLCFEFLKTCCGVVLSQSSLSGRACLNEVCLKVFVGVFNFFLLLCILCCIYIYISMI